MTNERRRQLLRAVELDGRCWKDHTVYCTTCHVCRYGRAHHINVNADRGKEIALLLLKDNTVTTEDSDDE